MASHVCLQDRGITLQQLRAVWEHIKAHCVHEGWEGDREFTAEHAGLPWVEEAKPTELSTPGKQVWHKIKLTPELVSGRARMCARTRTLMRTCARARACMLSRAGGRASGRACFGPGGGR